jgi:hypothetical protein
MNTILIIATENPGSEYTLYFPNGNKKTVGDAQPEYWALANAIDAIAEMKEVD